MVLREAGSESFLSASSKLSGWSDSLGSLRIRFAISSHHISLRAVVERSAQMIDRWRQVGGEGTAINLTPSPPERIVFSVYVLLVAVLSIDAAPA